MKRVAHQCILLQFLFELAKQSKASPFSVLDPYFRRMKDAPQPYVEMFNEELNAFVERIKKRARDKASAVRNLRATRCALTRPHRFRKPNARWKRKSDKSA